MSPVTTIKTKLTVDFTDVEDRRGGAPAAKVTPGDYLLEVVSADVRKKNDSDSEYVNWQTKIVGGPEGLGKTVYHITSLKHESLWSLRNWLSDLLSKDIPRKKAAIDLASYKGKRIGATLGDANPFTKSDGTVSIKSEVQATYPAAAFDGGVATSSGDDDDPTEGATSGDTDENMAELEVEDL